MRVLLACIHDERCEACLSYTVGVLSAQRQLMTLSDVHTMVTFFPSVEAAFDQFGSDETLDVLVVSDTMLGLNPDFVTESLKVISELHFITGVFPLPGVDWQQMIDKLKAGSAEDVRYQGLKYNVEFAKPIATDSTGERLLVKSAKLRTFVIDRKVYDTVADEGTLYKTESGKGCVVWAKDVKNERLLDESASFMAKWNGNVWVDIVHRLSGFGLESFQGAVGYRQKIR